MFKKWNRILAFLLSIALVTTTFGSDFASATAYAVEDGQDLEDRLEEDELFEEATLDEEEEDEEEVEEEEDEEEEVEEDEDENTSENFESLEDEEEGTPEQDEAEAEPEYVYDEDGNIVLDENGNPVIKEKAVEELEEDETDDNTGLSVKIYYAVSDEEAGYVDNASDVYGEGKTIAGSTAYENDGYEFINWTDEDGKEVSDDYYFAPTASDLGISEDEEEAKEDEESEDTQTTVRFTANFEPAGPTFNQRVQRTVTVDDIEISFWAAAGVLPDDARFEVERVYPDVEEAIESDLEEVLNEESEDNKKVKVEVKDTISFDINIYADSYKSEDNEDGRVEFDDGTVRVTFRNLAAVAPSASDADTGLAVYHVDGSEVEFQDKTDKTSSDTIGFDAEHFSVYSVTIYNVGDAAYGRKLDIEIRDINNQNKSLGNITANVPAEYDTVIAPKSIADTKPIQGYRFVKATILNKNTHYEISAFKLRNSKSYYIADYIDCKIGETWYQNVTNYGTVYFWYEADNGNPNQPVLYKHHVDMRLKKQSDYDQLKDKMYVIINNHTPVKMSGRGNNSDPGFYEYTYTVEVSTNDKIQFEFRYNINDPSTWKRTKVYSYDEMVVAANNCGNRNKPNSAGFDFEAKYDEFNYNFTVKYDPNGGEGTAYDDAESTNVIGETAPADRQFTVDDYRTVNFTKDGYTLIGWNRDKDKAANGEKEDFPNNKVTVKCDELVTLYAVWSKSKHTVTVTGDEGFSAFSGAGEYEKDNSVTVAATLKEGYEFVNWTTNKPGVNVSNNTFTMPNDDITVTAHSKKKEYTIRYFDGYSGEGKDLLKKFEKQQHGENTPTIPNPTRDYYVFAGWNPSVAAKVTGNADYVAQWTRQYEQGKVVVNVQGGSKTYDGDPLKADYTVSGLDAVGKKGSNKRFQVVLTYKNISGDTSKATLSSDGTALSITDAGSVSFETECKIIDTQKNNADVTEYFGAPSVTVNPASLTVQKRAISVKTGSETKAFDGSDLVVNKVYVLVNGGEVELAPRDAQGYGSYRPIAGKNETIKFRTKSSRKYPGTEKNLLDTVQYVNGAKEGNYDISVEKGDLTVTLVDAGLKIAAGSIGYVYNGKKQKYDSVTATGFPTGYTVTANTTADSYVYDFTNVTTDKLERANKVDKDTIVILDENKQNVTSQFRKEDGSFGFTITDGTITLKKREITVTSGNGSWPYDGKAHSNTVMTDENVTGDGTLAEGQHLSDIVTFSDFTTVTEVTKKKVDNKYTATPTPKDLAKNYKITYKYGELEITARGLKGSVVARDAENEYTGNPFTAADVKNKYTDGKAATITLTEGTLATGDELVATTTGSVTNVADVTTGNHVVSDIKIMHGTKDVTKFYDLSGITKTDGTLTITRAHFGIVTYGGSKPYDGTKLTSDWLLKNDSAYTKATEIVGLKNNETATIAAVGEQLTPGTSPNYYATTGSGENKTPVITWGSAKATNYFHDARKDVLGNLTVTNDEKTAIALSVLTDEKLYNAVPLSFNADEVGLTFDDKSNSDYELRDVTFAIVSGTNQSTSQNSTEVSRTDAGAVTYKVASYKIYDTKNNIDVTTYFNAAPEAKGTLTVNKRTINLVAASGSKQYDGSELTGKWLVDNDANVKEEVTVSGDGFVGQEGFATLKTTGTVTYKSTGEVANPVEYTLKTGTNSDNYTINDTPGKLWITDRTDKYTATFVAKSDTQKYSGKEIKVDEFDPSPANGTAFTLVDGKYQFTAENNKTYQVSGIYAEAKKTDAGTYDVLAWKDGLKVEDLDGNDVTDQFDISVTSGTLVIQKRKVTLTSKPWSKPYDGKPLSNATELAKYKEEHGEDLPNQGVTIGGEDGFATYTDANGNAVVEGVNITFDDVEVLYAGDSKDNTFTYAAKNNTNLDNYEITPYYGKLEITGRTNKYVVTVVAKSDLEKIYKGEDQNVTGFKEIQYGSTATKVTDDDNLSFMIDGVAFRINGYKTPSVTEKNAGEYDVKIQKTLAAEIGGITVTDVAGKPVTDQFTVNTVDGQMVIGSKPITIKSVGGTKDYDGQPLDSAWLVKNKADVTEDDVITIDGLVDAEDDVFKTLETTGSALWANESNPNTINYKFKNDTMAKNYSVSLDPGQLSVTNRTAKYNIVVIANSDEIKYDGTEKTVSGFKEIKYTDKDGKTIETFPVVDDALKFKINDREYTLTGYEASGAAATHVKPQSTDENRTNSVSGKAVVTTAGKNVDDQFSVTAESGSISITPRTVTLKAGDDEKIFDGTPLKSATYSVLSKGDGFAVHDDFDERKGITVYVKGSQTNVGERDNIIDHVDFDKGALKDDYTVSLEKGKLEVLSVGDNKIQMFVSINVDDTGKNEIEKLYNGDEQFVKAKLDVTTDGSETIINVDPESVIGVDDDDPEAEPAEEKTKAPVIDSASAESIIRKLMSLGTITAYAAEGEDTYSATVKYGDATFVIGGIKLKGGSGTDVGDYELTIDTSEMTVTVAGFPVNEENNMISQFDIEVITPQEATGDDVVGILHIIPRHVVLSSDSFTKTYDGTPLTRPVVRVTGDEFVEGEVMDLRATGSITEVGGPVANTISYKFDPKKGQKYIDDPELFTKNYVIETNTGSLSIVAAPTPVDDDDDDDDTPSGGDTTTIPDAPVALAPAGQVLGAQRETGDGPAVLGARRAGTDDETNRMARVFAMVAAAAIAVTMLITGKKKDEEEEG